MPLIFAVQKVEQMTKRLKKEKKYFKKIVHAILNFYKGNLFLSMKTLIDFNCCITARIEKG